MKKQTEYILARFRAAGFTADTLAKITLTTYADDDALKLFRPDEHWDGGAAEHKAAMQSVRAELLKHYPKLDIALVEIDVGEYAQWLAENGRQDSPAQRAEFGARKNGGL